MHRPRLKDLLPVTVRVFDPEEVTTKSHREVDPRGVGLRTEDVEAAVSSRLMRDYGAVASRFSDRITVSEVVATISSVAGVGSVELTELRRAGGSRDLEPVLEGSPARWSPRLSEVVGAEVLELEVSGPQLHVVDGK